jgi:hypothetical protein
MPAIKKDVKYKWKQEQSSKPWKAPVAKTLHPWSVDQEITWDAGKDEQEEEVSKEALRLLRDIAEQKHKTSLDVEDVLRDDEPKQHLIRSGNYTSVEIHGMYGLIDQDPPSIDKGGDRDVIAHMPRWVKGHSLDIRPGDIISVVGLDQDNKKQRRVLMVTYTTPDKYYAPGARVSTLRLGVREHVDTV